VFFGGDFGSRICEQGVLGSKFVKKLHNKTPLSHTPQEKKNTQRKKKQPTERGKNLSEEEGLKHTSPVAL